MYRIDGSSIAARRISDGKEVYRDSSKFKLVNAVVHNQREILNQDHLHRDDDSDEEPEDPDPEPDPAPQQPVQRPQRNRRLPARLNDYHLDWQPA